jgi:alpha-beta hydrolase superfamily lysophospholipase
MKTLVAGLSALVLFLTYAGAVGAEQLPAGGNAGGTNAQMKASDQALDLILADQIPKAEDVLLDAYKEGTASKSLIPEIPYFLAVMSVHHENNKDAIKFLTEARDLFASSQNANYKPGSFDKMLLDKRLGDCYYRLHDTKKALEQYEIALSACKNLPDAQLSLSEILEAMAACQIDLKQNADAEKSCVWLVETTKDRLKNGNLYDTTNYCWALLQAADFYRDMNQQDKMLAMRKQIRDLFTSLIRTRSVFQAQAKVSDYEALGRLLRHQYIGELTPDTAAEKCWAGSDFRMRTLPVVAWANLKDLPKAAIVCLHGLGLENRAFFSTANELNKRGYIVYALDVRGFGSWTQTKGLETLDYSRALTDIANVVQVIKKENPTLPIFILGESMGGAIALRAGGQLQDVVDGVIASVPSAERFQQRKMALTTAVHFMIDPKASFSIHDYVADRATSNDQVREKWANDPKAKLGMTPIELMKFAVFMRTTKEHAAEITKIPVLVAQGLKDRLVKPEGTFAIFDAVKSEDKTLLLIGTAEHLMFETMAPSSLLIDSVDSWLKLHLPTPVAQGH